MILCLETGAKVYWGPVSGISLEISRKILLRS